MTKTNWHQGHSWQQGRYYNELVTSTQLNVHYSAATIFTQELDVEQFSQTKTYIASGRLHPFVCQHPGLLLLISKVFTNCLFMLNNSISAGSALWIYCLPDLSFWWFTSRYAPLLEAGNIIITRHCQTLLRMLEIWEQRLTLRRYISTQKITQAVEWSTNLNPVDQRSHKCLLHHLLRTLITVLGKSFYHEPCRSWKPSTCVTLCVIRDRNSEIETRSDNTSTNDTMSFLDNNSNHKRCILRSTFSILP